MQTDVRVEDEDRVRPGGLPHTPVYAARVTDVGRAHHAASAKFLGHLCRPVARSVIYDDYLGRQPVESSRQRVEKVTNDMNAVICHDNDIEINGHG